MKKERVVVKSGWVLGAHLWARAVPGSEDQHRKLVCGDVLHQPGHDL